MTIFKTGDFISHSGLALRWKIDCEGLTAQDWDWLAQVIAQRFNFGGVTGVPRGGLELEARLKPHAMPGIKNYLIVDDVYTTGASLQKAREQLVGQQTTPRFYFGIVAFARFPIAPVDKQWVRAVFQYWND